MRSEDIPRLRSAFSASLFLSVQSSCCYGTEADSLGVSTSSAASRPNTLQKRRLYLHITTHILHLNNCVCHAVRRHPSCPPTILPGSHSKKTKVMAREC